MKKRFIILSCIILGLVLALFFNSQILSKFQRNYNRSGDIKIKIDPKTFGDFLKTDHVKYYKPGVMAIEKRLAQIDKIMTQRGLIAKRTVSYGYGSGFLNFIKVGNDLDYGCIVDLGFVKYHRKDPQQTAELLIKRVENYLNVTKELFDHNNSPELSGFGFHADINDQGAFSEHDLLKFSLADQLTKLSKKETIRKIVKSTYVNYVPMHLKKNETVLDAGLMIKYLSDKVRFSEKMLSGIREISVVYSFIFNLEISDDTDSTRILKCILYPTFFPIGEVFNERENLFLYVWINEDYYQRHIERMYSPSSDEFDELLHQYGGSFIMMARNEMFRDRKIKMIKRIHQAYDGLKEHLNENEKKDISERLKEWLGGPAATILETFKEESAILKQLVGRDDLYQMYLQHGDISRIMNYFSESINILGRQYHTQNFIHLKEHVDRLLQKDVLVLTADDFKQLKDLSIAFQNEILPNDEEFKRMMDKIQEVLTKLGYLLVRINGVEPSKFLVNIYDLNDSFKEVPSINYLKNRGFPVFQNVSYALTLKRKIDTNPYSKTYWLSP